MKKIIEVSAYIDTEQSQLIKYIQPILAENTKDAKKHIKKIFKLKSKIDKINIIYQETEPDYEAVIDRLVTSKNYLEDKAFFSNEVFNAIKDNELIIELEKKHEANN